MSDYDDALSRALAYTDEVGLSDGTDRPTDSVDRLIDEGLAQIVDAREAVQS